MSEQKTKYDIIVIGAGPAGYTAGIYSSRARRDTLLISGILPGGQLMNTTDVENYPGFDEGIMGPDLMITMRKQDNFQHLWCSLTDRQARCRKLIMYRGVHVNCKFQQYILQVQRQLR